MENLNLVKQFVSDLQIEGCVVHYGKKNKVHGQLTPENVQRVLEKHSNEDVYFLSGVGKDKKVRASDKDITRKCHFYLDFDIRNYWRDEYGEGVSNIEIKEIAVGLLESLKGDQMLRLWRYAVFTGNGMHLHYLGNPVPIESVDRWKSGMMQIIKKAESYSQMELDDSCKNAARLSRLPGSRNYKNNHKTLVEFIEVQRNASFDISIIERLGNTSKPSKGQDLSKKDGIPKSQRNSTLIRIGGSLRHRGLGEDAIFAALLSVNESQCKPPLEEKEVRKIAKSAASYENSTAKKLTPVTLCLADVEKEEIEWLWAKRIPKGKLTMIDGDPGLGKSWCCFAVATSVTNGVQLPGDNQDRKPSNVLLLTAEDSASDTLRPRMENLGANLTRITVLTGARDENNKEHHFSIAKDLDLIEDALSEKEYALIIIDPLNAYLGGDIDTYKDSDIRTALTPIAKLAEKWKVAILCIRHLTKSSGGKSIYRGLGSIAYTAAARSVLGVAIHPDNESQRVIVPIKNNLCSPALAVAYEIDEDGYFSWKGEVDVPLDSIFEVRSDKSYPSPALDDAKNFLLTVLWGDEDHKITDILAEAKDAGISKKTLERAAHKMEIRKTKKEYGEGGYWIWELPKKTKDSMENPWSSLEKKDTQEQLPLNDDSSD